MIIKCNPCDIVDVFVLVDITSCLVKVEPYCHDPQDNTLLNDDGTPLFFELLAIHLSTPYRRVKREERMKDGKIREIESPVPVNSQRLCIFEFMEEAYEALAKIEESIKKGDCFLDLS